MIALRPHFSSVMKWPTSASSSSRPPRAIHPAANDATADQWFDESQFESYRALGLHIVSQLTAAMRGDMTPSLPEFRWSVLDYMGDAAIEAAAAPRAAAPRTLRTTRGWLSTAR